MKYIRKNGEVIGEDVNPFEDDKVLGDLWGKYGAVKEYLRANKLPPHDSNLKKYFEQLHGVQLTIEEMMELRDFFENDYEQYIRDKISADKEKGMTFVDPRFYI